jgi:hypothetical protein
MDAFSGITTHKEVRMDAKYLAGTGAADLVAPDNQEQCLQVEGEDMSTALKIHKAKASAEFLRLHALLKKHFGSFVEFGETLAEVQRLWKDWSLEDRNGYGTFKDYLRFEFDVDEGYASKSIRSSAKYRVLESSLEHAQGSILPKTPRQAEVLIGIPDKELPKVWKGIIKDATHKRDLLAKTRDVDPDSIDIGSMLSAKLIASNTLVMQHKGESPFASIDSSVKAIIGRRIWKAIEYLDDIGAKYENLSELAEKEKWTKDTKNGLRETIKQARIAMEQFDERLKRLRLQD